LIIDKRIKKNKEERKREKREEEREGKPSQFLQIFLVLRVINLQGILRP
jgi:hypothetical protein